MVGPAWDTSASSIRKPAARSRCTAGLSSPALNAAMQFTTKVVHRAWAVWSRSWRWRT